jgi:starch synthase
VDQPKYAQADAVASPDWRKILRTKVLIVASEALPLAKTGGLADAVSGMALALRAANVDVTVLMPAYRSALRGITGAETVEHFSDLPGGDATLISAMTLACDLPVLLLRNDSLYHRDGSLYLDEDGREYEDNAVRFAALAHAAARIAAGKTSVAVPHIVHAQDWHAGLVPLLMRSEGATDVKSVVTIHNLAFQGLFPMELADAIGLPQDCRSSDGVEFWGKINYLKAGIRYADRVTTVSETYAREVLTPEFGCGLEGLLASRGSDFVAVPNGVDIDIWDPALDSLLPDHFSPADLRGKTTCKRELQETYGLIADPWAPVLAMGSRLTTQKMADVAAGAIPMALDANPRLQVVVLGCGDRQIETQLTEMAQRYPGRCAVSIGYDERAGHLLHAGADMLLHGSRFEPFGLTPIYSMRYGTVPVASRVGGMADTIADPGAHADADALADATGVLFDGDSFDAMFNAIQRAMDMFKRPELWRAIQRNGMTGDYSWDLPAGKYIDIYRNLLPASAFEPAQRVVSVAEPVKQVANPAPALGVATRDADVTPPKAVTKRVASAAKAKAKTSTRDSSRNSSARDTGGAAAAV